MRLNQMRRTNSKTEKNNGDLEKSEQLKVENAQTKERLMKMTRSETMKTSWVNEEVYLRKDQ